MTTNIPLTELERQEKYLEQLPDDFTFPLFNAQRALESQRRSGYRDTAAAGREIVDNAIEAGADTVHIVLDTDRVKGNNQRVVSAVAFIDNGTGMLPTMARYALTWGGGTHFEDHGFIGKFGFGLPNASINQTKRTEVYTRTAPDQPFTKVRLDITEFKRDGLQQIPPPETAELPPFVQQYLDRTGLVVDHGTIVVWEEPDRLTYKRPAPLKEHFLDDFGVTYRYLLGQPRGNTGRPLQIVVEGKTVERVDPLFLMPNARLHLPEDQGGARLSDEWFIPVRYVIDELTGERHLLKADDAAEIDLDDPQLITAGTIHVRIATFPVGFVVGSKPNKGEPITDAHRRFEYRKGRRGMSFVRANREIETIDVFPRSERDKANGMGDWPLLQSYAYHWGIEAKFTPELDEVFGITNDKQSVRPVEDFWRVLTQAGIDAAARRENTTQGKVRRRTPIIRTEPGGPTPATEAASRADIAASQPLQVPNNQIDQARANLAEAAEQRAKLGKETVEEARIALEREARKQRYAITHYESEDGPFYKPVWIGGQVVVQLNRLHPFFQILYRELLDLPGGARAKEAVDLVLLALGRGELTAGSDEMLDFYEAQRKYQWSPFLATSLKILDQRLPHEEEDLAADD